MGYTQINIGETDIVVNYNTILHIIKPIEIKKIITDLEINESKLPTDMTNTLTHQIETLIGKLETLIPHRHKRGLLNFIGTIHKWIYGTMDNQDRKEIENHLKTIDTNN